MNRTYKTIFLLSATVCSTFAASCSKVELENISIPTGVAARQDDAIRFDKVKMYKKSSLILADLLSNDPSIIQVVKEGLRVSNPAHENISFKELIDNRSKNNIIAKNADYIKNNFNKYKEKYNSNEIKYKSTEELLDDLSKDGTQIYFPYHEKFSNLKDLADITISYDPVEQDDISEGFKIDIKTKKISKVLVDDDYAYAHPTLIVMEDDAALATGNLYNLVPTDPSEPIPNEPYPTEPVPTYPNSTTAIGDTVTEVYIGGIRLKENLDGLFDGGNEVTIVRSDTYISLDATGRVVAGTNGYITKSVYISRVNARDKNYVYVNSLFDSDWIRNKTSQHFAIYEHDPHKTKTEKTTTGLSVTSNGITLTSNVENTLTYSTDHILYGSQVYYRNSFLNTNTIPLWNGTLKDGFRLYTDGPFEYTFPHRIMIFKM